MMPIAPRDLTSRPSASDLHGLQAPAMKPLRSANAPALRLVDPMSGPGSDVRDPSRPGAEDDAEVDVDLGDDAGDDVEEALAAAARRAAVGELDPATEDVLRQWLQRRMSAYLKSGRARIIFTDNVHTMLSVKRGQGVYTLRMHRMFAAAPPAVLRAVVHYAQSQD